MTDEQEDERAEAQFKINQEAFNKIYDNERGGFLRDLINDVEALYDKPKFKRQRRIREKNRPA